MENRALQPAPQRMLGLLCVPQQPCVREKLACGGAPSGVMLEAAREPIRQVGREVGRDERRAVAHLPVSEGVQRMPQYAVLRVGG